MAAAAEVVPVAVARGGAVRRGWVGAANLKQLHTVRVGELLHNAWVGFGFGFGFGSGFGLGFGFGFGFGLGLGLGLGLRGSGSG